jgi:(S)-3,5-dihydroxyphenylglycine transaminase
MTDQGARQRHAELAPATLHASLEDPALTSMNFLNEIVGHHPDAVSFAPGRPFEEFFDVAALHTWLDLFCDHLRNDRGFTEQQVRTTLFQYGRTKGIVHELVARHLMVDEGIDVDPEHLVVTVGCQEAMFLVLRALRATERDVLLSVSPTYVGLTGAARLLDLPVLPVSPGGCGVDLVDLAAQVAAARDAGLRPRACYVMPDFANPSGGSLDLETRRRLLELAEREDLLLIEDNPYGLFHDGDGRLPTLKALDTACRVVYLGSFAKTALPGARVGYVVADQRVQGSAGTFADELSKIKSMITVNTSPVAQAIVGGRLLQHGGSLTRANIREREIYQGNLRHLLHGLKVRFGDLPQVQWNVPTGGFFIVLTLPFVIDDELLEYSARVHGVLWTPMQHFYGGSGGRRQMRLSFSSLDPRQIELGLDRLAALVADPMVRARSISSSTASSSTASDLAAVRTRLGTERS